MVIATGKWTLLLIVSFLCSECIYCNSVEQKIYVTLNKTVPCVRLLNATHQIGCQSSISGDTGVIHVVGDDSDLEWVLKTGNTPPYMVLLDGSLFTREVMIKMKDSSRVAGVAVVVPKKGPEGGFSPHQKCPNDKSSVYSNSYGEEYAHCNKTVWNPLGNDLSYEDFHFPIFMMQDENETEVVKKCFFDHNVPVNGSGPSYPLCAMQLFSHMHAATNTVTCMRRNDLQATFSINPEVLCDPLSDYNIYSFLHPVNKSRKNPEEKVIIAAARMDTRSFFWDFAPGGESAVSGFVTLLAVAETLSKISENLTSPLKKNILFSFFQGEVFDYIGSSRMVYDMQKGTFVIGLENIDTFIEIGQVGLRSASQLWIHSDPVSRQNASIDNEVRNLSSTLMKAGNDSNVPVFEPSVSQPLPPSSFQSFLKAQYIPGVVLTDHQSAFSNRYYESIYDTSENLNLSYPSELGPEEQLEFVTATAQSLSEVATVVAKTLFKQAGGSEEDLFKVQADPKTVTKMLYGFAIRSNNSWFRSLVNQDVKPGLVNGPPQYYVGVVLPNSSPKQKRLIQYVLANLTGTVVNLTKEQCQNTDKGGDQHRELYDYIWIQGSMPLNGSDPVPYCVRSTVRLSDAVSPAFDLKQYGALNYSTWTESRWKEIKARIFLVSSKELEMLTLAIGIAILVISLLVTYFISTKADILFTVSREPTTAAY
ncbi:nicastrin [Polypterus senegalus]|uniref:nicastrin n=1 Tax=Polypterus senegalus TaxID=55291 RepID=UPI0019648A7E|nr:nicastrin [Polypterus senegalus]